MQVSHLLSKCTNELEIERTNILKFWGHSLIKKEYPCLYYATKAAFIIFHGLQIKGSFSGMQSILSSSKPSTEVSTFSAIQTVKYHLKSEGKSSIKLFGRKDKYSLVDRRMCADVRMAHSRCQTGLSGKNMKKCQRLNVLSAGEYDKLHRREKARFVERQLASKRKAACCTWWPHEKRRVQFFSLFIFLYTGCLQRLEHI